MFSHFKSQGLTGPIGPPGPSGPNGEKVIIMLFIYFLLQLVNKNIIMSKDEERESV